jgi:ATP-dependent DNA helicase RecG
VNVTEVVAELRAQGNDTEGIEAKRAVGGLPEDLALTLSAFANRPGGGRLVLGIDERAGFAAVGLSDAKTLRQGLADVARSALEPPVRVESEAVEFEGRTVVVAEVREAARSAKPVRVKRTGRAYLRQYDGTFPLSDLEEQAFAAARGQPDFDTQPVPAASRSDLDQSALTAFVRDRRAASSVFRDWDDEQVLTHAHVLARDGRPTLAGLLGFGLYPQEFVPNSGVQASLWSGPSCQATSQLLDSHSFSGPIPTLVYDLVNWVGRSTATAVAQRPDGHLVDAPQYPPVAVREFVANALVHRDLGPHAFSSPVSLVLEPGQLVITNPGGLFGLRVEALGRTTSHLRNAYLAELMLTARTLDGMRVIERLGSGIPRAESALRAAGLPAPIFHDSGVRFTVRIVSLAQTPRPRGTSGLNGSNTDMVLAAVAAGAATVAAIAEATGLTSRQTRYALGSLERDRRVVVSRMEGRRPSTYTSL